MRKYILLIALLALIASCQSKSDCFGGRIIIGEIKTVVKYEKWRESMLIEKKGEKYVACNYPDTLTKNQNYIAVLKLLETELHEE